MIRTRELDRISKEFIKISRRVDGVKNDFETRHKIRAKSKSSKLLGLIDELYGDLEEIVNARNS